MFSLFFFPILKLLYFKNLFLIGNINNFVLFKDTNVMFQLLHFLFQLLLANLLWYRVNEDRERLKLFMYLFPVLFQPLKMGNNTLNTKVNFKSEVNCKSKVNSKENYTGDGKSKKPKKNPNENNFKK